MKLFQISMVLVLCTTLFCSCESLIEKFFGKDEELTFVKSNYAGNQLRTDGYYYNWRGIPNNDESIVKILFLYRNGIVLEGGNPYFRELETFEDDYKSGQFNKYANKYKSSWGLFIIDSISIQYEKLHGGPFRAYIDSGKIINDTTFVILKRKSSYGTDEKVLQDTFRLKPFSPKPDSTNIFIK